MAAAAPRLLWRTRARCREFAKCYSIEFPCLRTQHEPFCLGWCFFFFHYFLVNNYRKSQNHYGIIHLYTHVVSCANTSNWAAAAATTANTKSHNGPNTVIKSMTTGFHYFAIIAFYLILVYYDWFNRNLSTPNIILCNIKYIIYVYNR